MGQDVPSAVTASQSIHSEGFSVSYSSPALGTAMNSVGGGGALAGQQQRAGMDMSEFDPIPVSTAGGCIMPPGELQVHPSSKHRT